MTTVKDNSWDVFGEFGQEDSAEPVEVGKPTKPPNLKLVHNFGDKDGLTFDDITAKEAPAPAKASSPLTVAAGYFLLWRKIWSSDLNTVSPSTFKVAIYCISKANYQPYYAKKGDHIKVGAFATSNEEMAAAIHMAQRTVQACLKELVLIGFLSKKSTGRGTIITIRNYSQYQTEFRDAKNDISDKQKTAPQIRRSSTTIKTSDESIQTNASFVRSSPNGQLSQTICFNKKSKQFEGEDWNEFKEQLTSTYDPYSIPVELVLNEIKFQLLNRKTPPRNLKGWILKIFANKTDSIVKDINRG